MIRLVGQAFDPGASLARFCAGREDVGAVAAFIGRVRRDGGEGLELEAYPRFTQGEIGALVEAAQARFGLIDVEITHRLGRIPPGDAIVQVLTAATHRRAAFEACDYLMDHLKSAAPLWKKEWSRDGPRWVEPTDADLGRLDRWRAA